MEESFKQIEGGGNRRKEISPVDTEEITKKERAERIEDQQSPLARCTNIDRSPQQQHIGEGEEEREEMVEILNN